VNLEGITISYNNIDPDKINRHNMLKFLRLLVRHLHVEDGAIEEFKEFIKNENK